MVGTLAQMHRRLLVTSGHPARSNAGQCVQYGAGVRQPRATNESPTASTGAGRPGYSSSYIRGAYRTLAGILRAAAAAKLIREAPITGIAPCRTAQA